MLLSAPVMTEAARRLAQARGETVEEVLRRFPADQLDKLPARFSKHLPALRKTAIAATGVENGLAWVRLDSGRIFYSPISHGAIRRQYPFIADTIPATVTEDTLLAAVDVVQRYITDVAWPPDWLVGNDSNIIELGAYLGHKTIRFAEELAGNNGKILAVEMMPDNCEILRRNIEANGFADRIEVLPVGVWGEAGSIQGYSKGRQRNSILPIDKLGDGERFEATTQTLNQIIDDWWPRPVDLVFVTVNGVEKEVLAGFEPNGREVKAFFIATPKLADKSTNRDPCRDRLADLGYDVLESDSQFRVIARSV